MHILRTSHSAILVNGVPGPWINCRRGLRQGDPISPYLFILVADVLRSMIKADSGFRHPIVQHGRCSVLQYADDTLLLVRGDPSDIARLHTLLDQFAAATGLQINYNKSTAVPIHMEEETVAQCITVLGCRREGFPKHTSGCHFLTTNFNCLPLPLDRQGRQVPIWLASFFSESHGASDADQLGD